MYLLGRLIANRWFNGVFAAGCAIALVLAVGSWRYGTGSDPARFLNVI